MVEEADQRSCGTHQYLIQYSSVQTLTSVFGVVRLVHAEETLGPGLLLRRVVHVVAHVDRLPPTARRKFSLVRLFRTRFIPYTVYSVDLCEFFAVFCCFKISVFVRVRLHGSHQLLLPAKQILSVNGTL